MKVLLRVDFCGVEDRRPKVFMREIEMPFPPIEGLDLELGEDGYLNVMFQTVDKVYYSVKDLAYNVSLEALEPPDTEWFDTNAAWFRENGWVEDHEF